MLIRIFRKMNLSENRTKELMESYVKFRIIFSAIFYTLMVFIVISGISRDVYAGFPKPVPYVIIAVFLFMAFVRMYQGMVDDSYVRQQAAKKIAAGNGRGSGKDK